MRSLPASFRSLNRRGARSSGGGNTQMVLAYWLIGREIVEELQGGDKRASYGNKVVEALSARLTVRYGKGFSVTNIWYFKQFYGAFPGRFQIPHPVGMELSSPEKSCPAGNQSAQGFSPQLTWSDCRALMRVENSKARDFYERDAVLAGWDKRTLERQIQSFYYERLLKSPKPEKMLAAGRQLPVTAVPAANALKHSYVLEFLGLPDAAEFHESDLERAHYQ